MKNSKIIDLATKECYEGNGPLYIDSVTKPGTYRLFCYDRYANSVFNTDPNYNDEIGVIIANIDKIYQDLNIVHIEDFTNDGDTHFNCTDNFISCGSDAWKNVELEELVDIAISKGWTKRKILANFRKYDGIRELLG